MIHLLFRLIFITQTNLTIQVGGAFLTLPYPECPTPIQDYFFSRCTNLVGNTTAYRDPSGTIHFTWTYPKIDTIPDSGPYLGRAPSPPVCSGCILDPDGFRFPLGATPGIIGFWTAMNGSWVPGELGSPLPNR